MPTREEITTFLDATDDDPWVRGGPPPGAVVLVAPDPGWPARFDRAAADLRAALGPQVLALDHVGSTSVPELAAKDAVDIALTVPDTADEDAYLPAIVALGYWHALREPRWYGHRMLRLDAPRVHLHVWPPGCPEPVRQRLFRDWLRAHPDDRRHYEAAKRAAVGPGTVLDYNARKQAVIREIYGRAFAAAGLL